MTMTRNEGMYLILKKHIDKKKLCLRDEIAGTVLYVFNNKGKTFSEMESYLRNIHGKYEQISELLNFIKELEEASEDAYKNCLDGFIRE